MREALTIRAASDIDLDAVWEILEPVFRAGDTYSIDPDISREDALGYWCGPGHAAFVAEIDGSVIGTYYIRRNQGGGGGHVCNCGFATAPAARGQGVARAMLDHALAEAKARGFLAMQFNFVVSTNTGAIALWESAGFETVGRLPRAFRTPSGAFVDSLVMFRWLDQ